MKLFDIKAGEVVIHSDALGLPMFRKIWDSYKDKDLASKYISYIVLKNKYDSPYVKSLPTLEVEPKVKLAIFGDEDYKIPMDIMVGEEQYNEIIQGSLTLKLLKSARKKLDTVREYYDHSISDGLDDKKVKDITASIANLDKSIASLDKLERAVKAEELEMTTARGGAEINYFEQPRAKKL